MDNQPSSLIGKSIIKPYNAKMNKNKYSNMSHDELVAEVEKKAIENNQKESYNNFEYTQLQQMDDDNRIKAALELLDLQIPITSSYYTVSDCESDNLENIVQRAHELRNNGILPDYIFPEFLNTSEEHYNDIKYFLDKYSYVEASSIRDMNRLPKSIYDKFKEFIINEDLNISKSMLLASFCDEKSFNARIDKFYELKNAGKNADAAAYFAFLYNPNSPEVYNLALEFNKQGFDISDSAALARLDEETRTKVMKLLDRFNVSDAITIAKDGNSLNPNGKNLILKFKDLGCTVTEAMGFLYKSGNEATPEEAYKTLSDLLNRDEEHKYDLQTSKKLAKLKGQELELAKNYFNKCGMADLAIQFATDKTLTEKQHEYVNRLLDGGYFFGANALAKHPDIENILKEADRKNQNLADILSKDKDFSFEELTARDKYYLRTYGFDNEFYSPEEYVHKFLQLKNMTTKDGFHIFNTEHFQRKRSEDFAEMQSALNDGMLYNNLVKALWLNPSSDDAKYFEDFISLIQNGTISPSALRSLESGLVNGEGNSKKKLGSWTISENLKRDIDLYREIKSTSNNTNFNDNLSNAYIPSFDSEEEALTKTKIGDEFQILGEKYIRIKTKDSKSEKMNITKGTYEKLFPPVSRFSSAQQVIGDCYCIETFMSLYNDNRMRSQLIKTISEDDNGNITIKLPNSNTQVTYKDGKLPKNQNPEMYSSGADGFKLFEHTYSTILEDEIIQEAKNSLSGKRLNDFIEFINKNRTSKDGIFVYMNNGEAN